MGRNRPAFLAVAVAIAAITPSLVTLAAPSNVPLAEGQPYRREPNYDQALFNRDDSLLDVYQLAIAFADIVPREASDPGTVVFWYADQDDRAALVESTYLWHYNTVQVMPPGMPTLTDDQARELTGRTPRFLVLMGSDPSVVASGRRALDGLGLQHVSSEERVLRRGEASLTVDIEELVPAPCDGSTKGRLEVWALQPTCAPR